MHERGALAFALAVGLMLAVLPTAIVPPTAPSSTLENPFHIPSNGRGTLPTPANLEVRSQSSGQVTLVPGPNGTPTSCVQADASNPYPTATSGYWDFNGDLFNLPSGSVGQTLLCYNQTAQTLSDHTVFTQLPGAAQYGVLGYPEAIYGENIYGGPIGNQSPLLSLPGDQIRNLTTSSVWVSLNYSVDAPGNSPYDFAWDDWFSVLPANASSSGNVGNRIELMIWYSNDIGMYLGQTPISVPSFANGVAAPGTWFEDHYCQGSDEVTFDYLYAPDGATPGYGLPTADIALNFTYLLDNVSATLHAGACWAPPGTDIGSLYMDNSPLGAEFYPTTSDTADVNWTVDSLCYTYVAGPATAGAVACPSQGGGGVAPLHEELRASPTSGPAPLRVQFTATTSGGSPPFSYSWTFGDGSTAANLTTPSHLFLKAGNYTARVSVTDALGRTGDANVTVAVTTSSGSGSGSGSPPSAIPWIWGLGLATALGLTLGVVYWVRRRGRAREERTPR
jgi:PKD repeat protein